MNNNGRSLTQKHRTCIIERKFKKAGLVLFVLGGIVIQMSNTVLLSVFTSHKIIYHIGG